MGAQVHSTKQHDRPPHIHGYVRDWCWLPSRLQSPCPRRHHAQTHRGCQGKANPSCIPPCPRTTPSTEEKSIRGVIYGVLLWADMNAATLLWARVRSFIPLEGHHPRRPSTLRARQSQILTSRPFFSKWRKIWIWDAFWSQHLGCWGQNTSRIQNKGVYNTLCLQAHHVLGKTPQIPREVYDWSYHTVLHAPTENLGIVL